MPPYDPAIHNRRSIRIPGYDYAAEGMYFITICVQDRKPFLGRISDGVTVLNEIGIIVDETWRWLADQYDHVELGPYVVMPNHIHGIIMLEADEGVSRNAPTICSVSQTPSVAMEPRKPIGRLIGAFKTVSTKKVNAVLGTPGDVLWQRNYWEHVIRNETSFGKIVEYIENNPATWQQDQLFAETL